ncbi:MAG TPA: DUF5118 domain-containing protein, partial [Niastella sp.]|nr:DUF5118 domain-containing protein [Niastella sp.]
MGIALLFLVTSCATLSKNKKTSTKNSTMPPAGTSGMAGDSASKAAAEVAGPKTFASFFDTTKLRTQKGLMVVHWQDDKYYFEIPYALLGKDLLAVTRYVRTAAGAAIYGGEQSNENVLRFELGPENKV